jgi:hypothetical protein
MSHHTKSLENHHVKSFEDRHEICGESRVRTPPVAERAMGRGPVASPPGSRPTHKLGRFDAKARIKALIADWRHYPDRDSLVPSRSWGWRAPKEQHWQPQDGWPEHETLLATSWRPKFEVPKGKRWYSAQEISAGDGCWGRGFDYEAGGWGVQPVSTGRPVGRPRKGMQQPWDEIAQLVQILVMDQTGKELRGGQLNLDRVINIGEIARRTNVSKSNLYHWRDRYPAPRSKPSPANQAWLRQLGIVGNNSTKGEEKKLNTQVLEHLDRIESKMDMGFERLERLQVGIELARSRDESEEPDDYVYEQEK